jgi:hypothetical protein
MDWRLKARTPAEFEKWIEQTSPKLPKAVEKELARSLTFISNRTV